MNRKQIFLSGLVLALGLSACTSNDDGDDDDDVDEAQIPEEPAELSYQVPDNFTLDPDLTDMPYPLTDEYSAETYLLDGGTEFDVITVVSYVMPESTQTDSSEELTALADEYNETLESDSEADGIANVALINGNEGVFRRAVFEDADENERIQDSYFIFDGLYGAQVYCEWEVDVSFDELYEACQVVLQDFEIVLPDSD